MKCVPKLFLRVRGQCLMKLTLVSFNLKCSFSRPLAFERWRCYIRLFGRRHRVIPLPGPTSAGLGTVIANAGAALLTFERIAKISSGTAARRTFAHKLACSVNVFHHKNAVVELELNAIVTAVCTGHGERLVKDAVHQRLVRLDARELVMGVGVVWRSRTQKNKL